MLASGRLGKRVWQRETPFARPKPNALPCPRRAIDGASERTVARALCRHEFPCHPPWTNSNRRGAHCSSQCSRLPPSADLTDSIRSVVGRSCACVIGCSQRYRNTRRTQIKLVRNDRSWPIAAGRVRSFSCIVSGQNRTRLRQAAAVANAMSAGDGSPDRQEGCWSQQPLTHSRLGAARPRMWLSGSICVLPPAMRAPSDAPI